MNHFGKIKWFLVLMFLFPRAVYSNAVIYPVFADGWLVAGNKTVGTAVRLMRVGMWSEAQEELQKSVWNRPRNHAAQFNLGVCYERVGQLENAKRFYQRAVDLRPEALYCEGLARLDGVAGRGAEFVKFLIPCDSSCNHGYVFARAGMWEYASRLFENAYHYRSNATTTLNLAVAYEVLSNRRDADRMIRNASALGSNQQYLSFAHYLSSSSDLPLEMAICLPDITTVTDMPVLKTAFIIGDNAVLRLSPSHDSPVLAQLRQNTRVDVLSLSSTWTRVRTHQNKEGFLPTLFLSSEYVTEKTAVHGYSTAHSQAAVIEEHEEYDEYEDIYEQIFENPEPSITVTIPEDGNRVAIREKPSLMAEITGYLEPGDSLEVRESDVSSWYEIVDDSRPQGFILKMHTKALEKRLLGDEN